MIVALVHNTYAFCWYEELKPHWTVSGVDSCDNPDRIKNESRDQCISSGISHSTQQVNYSPQICNAGGADTFKDPKISSVDNGKRWDGSRYCRATYDTTCCFNVCHPTTNQDATIMLTA